MRRERLEQKNKRGPNERRRAMQPERKTGGSGRVIRKC
jgi:hypothetical protein